MIPPLPLHERLLAGATDLELVHDQGYGHLERHAALLREAAAALAASETSRWQTVETAPKDGTPVLILCGRKHNMHVAFGTYADGQWYQCWDGSLLGPKVTHWQPLPLPPVPAPSPTTGDPR